jgi:polysaccharide biosynthesis protein PslA
MPGTGWPSEAGQLEAPRPAALDEPSVVVRGPLRPRDLHSVRVRRGRRLASHAFRAADIAYVGAVTIAVLGTLPVAWLQIPVVQFVPLVVGALILLDLLPSLGAYRFDRTEGLHHHLVRVASTSVVTCGVSALVFSYAPATADRRAWWWALSTVVGLLCLHSIWWVRVGRWRSRQLLTPNVVLVGATPLAEDLIRDAMTRRDINVLGIFEDRLSRSPRSVLGVPVLGSTDALVDHRILPSVDLIVVAVEPSAARRVREITAKLAALPNAMTIMVDQDDQTERIAAITHLADAPLAPVGRAMSPDRKAVAKRATDLIIGIPMLLLFTPAFALIALAVKLDSPGPVFFRQIRHGFNNEEIEVRKFRTMHHEAADARGERQVVRDDDRITRVGRILRRTSLDEVPQLLNVIRGEMSLVGPRPHAVGMRTGDVESARLVAEYAHRHRIKPGLTGWAAVNGSRGPLQTAADVKRRVALDVEYIERQSLALDLKILLLTVPRLLGDCSTIR